MRIRLVRSASKVYRPDGELNRDLARGAGPSAERTGDVQKVAMMSAPQHETSEAFSRDASRGHPRCPVRNPATWRLQAGSDRTSCRRTKAGRRVRAISRVPTGA